MKRLFLTICMTVLALGCGAPADVTLNIDKKPERGIMVKSATVDKGEPRDDSTSYGFMLTSFDVTGKDLERYGPDLTAADQVKIHFVLVAEKSEENKDMKLITGSFRGANVQYGDKGVTINSFRVFTFANDEEDVWARMGSTKDSFVKLTSVTDDTVAGEFVFADGDESVKGKFTAKATKKEK